MNGDNPYAPYADAYQRDTIRWAKIAAGIRFFGVIGLVITIFLALTRAEMRQARYVMLATWTLELDKIYLANPDLIKYFEEGEEITKKEGDPVNNTLYYRARAVAEFLMDLADSMLDSYHDEWPDEGWKNWVETTFSKSQVLRAHLETQSTWYCKHLYPKYLEWAKKSGNNVPPQPTCK